MGRKRIHDLEAYKFSFMVEDDVKIKLDKLTDNYSTKYGPMLNFILRKLCMMPPKIKEAFIRFCKSQARELEKQIKVAEEFEKAELQQEKKHYLEIARIINDGSEVTIDEEQPEMIEIEIKDGILIIPEDWIIVNPEEAKKHRYAAVLECRNSAKFGIPHFIMYCDYKYGNEYPDEFDKKFKALCRKAWPDFKEKVEDKQVKAILKENGKGYVNGDQFMAAPNIGIFHIWESDDEHLEAYGEPPYGSMIVRTGSGEDGQKK